VRIIDITDPAHPRQVIQLLGHRAPVVALVAGGAGWLASTDADGVLLGWDLSLAAPNPVMLTTSSAHRDLATDGAGGELLSAPASGPAGSPALGSTNPARLVSLACRDPANRISPAEWRSLITDLAYEDPCAS
jgi:hypothetical protein